MYGRTGNLAVHCSLYTLYIWNPVSLNVNGQIGMYWSVLVRTSMYQYQQVKDFPNWYKPVQDGTRQYQIS